MKGFIKGLKELQQAGKKLADERKAIKAKELAEKNAIEAKARAEREKQLKEEREKEKELWTKIANVLTFSSSNVEINQNFGMVFCSTSIDNRIGYHSDSIGILEEKVLPKLKRQTVKRGGDAIINLRFDFTRMEDREHNGTIWCDTILLTGYGDAVKLRK